MRHRVKGRKLGRIRKTRRALIKSVLRSFVKYGKIETTLAKAKEVRIVAEKLVTKAKKGGLSERREMARWLAQEGVSKIFEISAGFKNRPGGYTRIIKTRRRMHDQAEMAILEFVK